MNIRPSIVAFALVALPIVGFGLGCDYGLKQGEIAENIFLEEAVSLGQGQFIVKDGKRFFVWKGDVRLAAAKSFTVAK